MPEYTQTSISLDVAVGTGRILTAAEQLQQQTQRLLYPEYYKIQDKITALITEIRAYNNKTLVKKINTVTLDMDNNTMSQKES